jgi:hypothetical protein
MRISLLAVSFVGAAVLLSGCVGGTGDFAMTSYKDGKVIGTQRVQSRPTDFSKDKYTLVLQEGKIVWSVKLNNSGSKRTYSTGVLKAYTDTKAVITINFGSSVEAKAKGSIVGAVGAVDLPKGSNIVNTSASVVENAGCENSLGIAGNWPETPLTATYEVSIAKSEIAVRGAAEPLIKLEVAVVPKDSLGVDFSWELTVINSMNREAICDLDLTFVGQDIDGKDLSNNGKPVYYKASKTVSAKGNSSGNISGAARFDIPVKQCRLEAVLVRLNGVSTR